MVYLSLFPFHIEKKRKKDELCVSARSSAKKEQIYLIISILIYD